MASEKILKEKQEQVAALAEEFKNAGMIMLVDYRGINVADDTELRKSIRESNGKYTIIKNNIVRRALAENGYEIAEDLLEGPTAVVITNEEYLPTLKAIYKYASSQEGFYNIKAGVLEGKTISKEELEVLAKLPSKEELIAKLAGVLLANVSKLAATLDAVRVKKESETAE